MNAVKALIGRLDIAVLESANSHSLGQSLPALDVAFETSTLLKTFAHAQ